MSRLLLLSRDEAPILSRVWYREDGSASALTRSLASLPDLLETLMPFLVEVGGESSIDLRTKELVVIRVSKLNGCRYCLSAHQPVALRAGVPKEQVDVLLDEAPLETLPPRERAVVAWVDQVTLEPHGITDELVEATLSYLRPHELIELTLLAGSTTMLNQYATAFDLPPPS